MPYARESLTELNRRLEAELPLANSGQALRRALYYPFARSLSGAVYGLHDHMAWRTRQMFPQTCDDDVLESIHVDLWLQGDKRNPAVAAQGKATLKGTADTDIPAGTLLNRNDGLQFAVITGVSIGAAGTVDVDVIATTPGIVGNASVGELLYLANPIAGVETSVKVVAISGGTDIESLSDLRQRVIDSRKLGGAVGKTADWVRWAKEVSGVTRAWAAPKLSGAGTVTVYFVRDGDAVIYPNAAARAEVQAHLEHSALPFGEIYAVAPVPKAINFSIKVEPASTEVKASVTAALEAVIKNNVSPVAYDEAGDLILPATGATILVSHLRQAISNATGEYDHELIQPAANVQLNVGELPTLGSIEWVS